MISPRPSTKPARRPLGYALLAKPLLHTAASDLSSIKEMIDAERTTSWRITVVGSVLSLYAPASAAGSEAARRCSRTRAHSHTRKMMAGQLSKPQGRKEDQPGRKGAQKEYFSRSLGAFLPYLPLSVLPPRPAALLLRFRFRSPIRALPVLRASVLRLLDLGSHFLDSPTYLIT